MQDTNDSALYQKKRFLNQELIKNQLKIMQMTKVDKTKLYKIQLKKKESTGTE